MSDIHRILRKTCDKYNYIQINKWCRVFRLEVNKNISLKAEEQTFFEIVQI